MRASEQAIPKPYAALQLPQALRTTRGWALAIFALALLVRVAYALVAPRIDPFLAQNPLLGDAASYDRIARTLMDGGMYGEYAQRPSVFWPPLFPMFLSLLYRVGGYHLMLGRLAQAVLNALLPPLLFLAVNALGKPVAARWVSLGALFYPFLIFFGAWLIAESLFLALLGWLLWIGARLQMRPTVRLALMFGAVGGLAALTKPTILMLFPFLVPWFLLCLRGIPMRRRLGLGVVAALALALVVGPWLAHNALVFGRFVMISTNGGYTFYGANNANAFGGHYERFPPKIPGLSEIDEQSEYYRRAFAWIASDPGKFTWLVGQKYMRLLSPLSIASSPQDAAIPGAWLVRIVYGGFLLTVALGAAVSLRRWREYFLFYALMLNVLVSTGLFYGDVRYTLPMVPALLVFAVAGGQALIQRWRDARS